MICVPSSHMLYFPELICYNNRIISHGNYARCCWLDVEQMR